MSIRPDNRPSDYEYAVLSNDVYRGEKINVGEKITINAPVTGRQEWDVIAVHKPYRGDKGYFGAIYLNANTSHLVLVHRGTDSIPAVIEDVWGIFFNKISAQKEAAYALLEVALGEISRSRTPLTLSTTGHSLGAYLAGLIVFLCYLRFATNPECGKANIRDTIHAVLFESVGLKRILEKLASNLGHVELDLNLLNIIVYLSYPNRITSCDAQIGSVYSLSPNTNEIDSGIRLKRIHSMDAIVSVFEKNSGMPPRKYMLDWPVGSEFKYFFEYVKLDESTGEYKFNGDEESILNSFGMQTAGHYRFDNRLSNWYSTPLRHFPLPMFDWLFRFYAAMADYLIKEGNNVQQLEAKLIGICGQRIASLLISCMIMKNEFSKSKEIYFIIDSNDPGRNIIAVTKELSDWLSKHAEQAGELLALVLGGVKSQIIADVLAPGSVLTKTGVIVNTRAVAFDTIIPADTTPEMLDHFQRVSRDFIQIIQNSNMNIMARVVAPGAHVEGRIENCEAVAVRFTVGALPKANIEGRIQEVQEASMAVAINRQREQDRLQQQFLNSEIASGLSIGGPSIKK